MSNRCSRSRAAVGRFGAVLVLAVALAPASLLAAKAAVSVRRGNIFIAQASGDEKHLTESARDCNPVLDPAGKWVVFTRSTDGPAVASGDGEHPAAELWQIRADGKEPSLLVRTRAGDRMERVIASFDRVQFSADGRLVYFVTAAWATSGAVHVVDTTNGKERFVVAGSGLHAITSGEYRDHLLVNQHRYFLGGGSYDWFYLFTPAGKEVGVVGESPENFLDVYGKGEADK